MEAWWLLQTIAEHVMFGDYCKEHRQSFDRFGVVLLFWFPYHLNLLQLSNLICLLRQTMTNFEPLHKLQAHDGYILKCLLSPELCEPNRLDFFLSYFLPICFKLWIKIVLFISFRIICLGIWQLHLQTIQLRYGTQVVLPWKKFQQVCSLCFD